MSDLSSFLNTGITSAYFKLLGYCKRHNALLKILYTKYEFKSLFSLIILAVISTVRVFLILNLLNSLMVSFNVINANGKLGHPREDGGCWDDF